jgi:anti-sigma factor RsiW
MSLELRHPEAGLLLPYLDGELPARKARQVRRHVQACWQCRTELEELQKAVGDCIRYRAQLRETTLSDPPRTWADLSAGFDRIDADLERGSPFRRPRARWTIWTVCSAALVAATITLHPWDRPAGGGAEPQPQAQLITPTPEITPAPALSAPASSGTMHPQSRAPHSEPAPVETSLASELRAVTALHQLGADLGEPVEVARQGQRVVIRGTGVSPARQQEIRQAMVSLPNIDFEFSQAQPNAPPAPAEPAPAPQSPTPPSPLETRLEAQLGGRGQFENFSSQLLDHEEAAMARIYALRRLATEFSSESEGQLSAANQQLLRDLARQHLEAMTREFAAINRIAAPVFGPVPSADSNQPEPLAWQAAAEKVFSSGRQLDSLMAGLLGLAASDDAQPRGFLAALAQIQASVQQCERLLMR